MVYASEPLDPAQAFRFSASAHAQGVLVHFDVAQGYYLYRDKLEFSVTPATQKWQLPNLPSAEMKNDEVFGRVGVYRGSLNVVLPMQPLVGQTVQVRVKAQGCADIGVCYPPAVYQAQIRLPIATRPLAKPPATVLPTAVAAAPPTSPLMASSTTQSLPNRAIPPNDESLNIRHLFGQASPVGLLLSFFGFGLLLAFTPCMLPMVPIVSSIVVGQSPRKGLAVWVSLAYVFGMSLAYALAGVAAGLSGTLLAAYLQNPWVLGGLAWVFVVLAGGMFGWFDMQLPSRWQTAVATHSNRWSGGRIGSAFVMGAVAAVVVGPCVAPPLAGALLYIGQTGDAWLGGWALFALAWGMGTPLLLLGASATFLLPKVGAWMNQVRQGFGVLLLANAWWLLNPLLSVPVQMLGWGVLLLGIAVWLRALDALPVRATALQRLSKGVGVLALVLALAQLSGALAGSRDPWQPLAVFRAAQATTASTPSNERLVWQPIASSAALRAAIQAAGDRPIVVKVTAAWCVSCRELEQFTLQDTRVKQRLAQAVRLEVDVTDNTPPQRALLRELGVFGPPAVLLWQHGKPTGRMIGYQAADPFLAMLRKAWP